MSKPGPCGAPGFGLGGMMMVGCGSSGAAVATAGVAAGAWSAAGAAAGTAAGVAAGGVEAAAADSELLEHAPSARAPQSATSNDKFFSMMKFYFTAEPKKKASTPAMSRTPAAVTAICAASIIYA